MVLNKRQLYERIYVKSFEIAKQPEGGLWTQRDEDGGRGNARERKVRGFIEKKKKGSSRETVHRSPSHDQNVYQKGKKSEWASLFKNK